MTDRTDARDSVQAVQVITVEGVDFSNPLPGVHVASQPISGCAWIETASLAFGDTEYHLEKASQQLGL